MFQACKRPPVHRVNARWRRDTPRNLIGYVGLFDVTQVIHLGPSDACGRQTIE